jgi:hypothetical protein
MADHERESTPKSLTSTRWLTPKAGLAIATLLSPLAVAYVAGVIANNSAKRAANVELIKLSVGILQALPSDSTRGLRRWAVDILGRYSEVPIPPELKGSLTNSVSLPKTGIGFGPNDNPPQ